MTKKRNSIAKLILCAVLAATMMFSIALPVLAEREPISTGTDAENPATAAFTKIFKMPINTTTPAAEFTFEIIPVSINDDKALVGKMPLLGNDGSAKVSFTAGDPATFIGDDGGTKYLVAQTPDILANLAKDGTPWTAGGAGIYKYHVKETQSGITLNTDPTYTGKEFEVYSEAEYDIEIWVVEDKNGILFPMYIVGYFIEGKPDEYYTTDEIDNGEKLDPTPGEEITVPGNPDEIGPLYSQIIFTNKYWKTDGTGIDPEDPKNPDPDPDINALEITKTVTGNTPSAFTKPYKFEVTVYTPALIGTTGTYKAYIVDKDGKLSSPIPFTSKVSQSVSLKHGERLVFFDLEVGAKVEVFETIETADTSVKYSHTFGPNATMAFTRPLGTPGTWGFPRDPEDKGPHFTIQGAGTNVVKFVNNVTGTPPTGITIDNLPYVMLLGIVLAGLVGFVVIKVRKNAKHDA